MKAYVKVFAYVPTVPMTRALDGTRFDDPLKSMLDVINRLASAGVATVGNYDNVVSVFSCESRYRAIPGSSANPTRGDIGAVHAEAEALVVFVAPKDALPALLKELKKHHPYETPVFDVFDLVRHEYDALA
jgi:hypothetical protein